MEYVAEAMKDVKLMGYAESLEESLLALSDRLMAVKDSKAIGERIQNEMLDGLFSNNDDLVDVIEIQNLQTWYFRKPQGPVSTRTRDLYHKIEQLGISEEKIGEAHSKADGDAGRITKELVDYKLEQQLKTVNVKDAAHADALGTFNAWAETAKKLRATLKTIFSDTKVLQLCQGVFPRSVTDPMIKALVREWKYGQDHDLLRSLNPENFSFNSVCSRAWMEYMRNCYSDGADLRMVSALTHYYPKIIPTLIQEGEKSTEADVLSLTKALEKNLQELVPP